MEVVIILCASDVNDLPTVDYKNTVRRVKDRVTCGNTDRRKPTDVVFDDFGISPYIGKHLPIAEGCFRLGCEGINIFF